MGIKVVVFDLGNVVELQKYDLFSERMARKYNLSKEEFKRAFLKQLRKTDKGILVDTKLVDAIGRELRRKIEKNDFFQEQFAQCAPNRAVLKLVKGLRRKYKVALFSNLNRMHARWSEKHDHLKSQFDVILFSYQYKARKPEVKFYKELLKKVNARPEECVFIDDQERNLKPARKLGMHTVLFNGRMNLARVLRTEAWDDSVQ